MLSKTEFVFIPLWPYKTMIIMNFRRLTAALLQVIIMLFFVDAADGQVVVENFKR